MISKIIKSIFTISPYFEVILRRLYWNFNIFHKFGQRLKAANTDNKKVIEGVFENLKKSIYNLDIKKGDILIVHSGMNGLSTASNNPNDFIDLLLELVGDEGTLVMPAYTHFDIKKKGNELIQWDDKDNYEPLFYNYRHPICWTGMIPSIFLRYKGVERSKFPVNSLAARGAHAKEMMKNNLNTDLAHGTNSAWAYCIENEAKILFLGIPSRHSLTCVHYVEDILNEKWIVKGWYKKQKYCITDGKNETEIIVRQKKLKWAKYSTELYSDKVLKKRGLIIEDISSGIHIEFIKSSKQLCQYLIDSVINGNMQYYKIPKKYYK